MFPLLGVSQLLFVLFPVIDLVNCGLLGSTFTWTFGSILTVAPVAHPAVTKAIQDWVTASPYHDLLLSLWTMAQPELSRLQIFSYKIVVLVSAWFLIFGLGEVILRVVMTALRSLFKTLFFRGKTNKSSKNQEEMVAEGMAETKSE